MDGNSCGVNTYTHARARTHAGLLWFWFQRDETAFLMLTFASRALSTSRPIHLVSEPSGKSSP